MRGFAFPLAGRPGVPGPGFALDVPGGGGVELYSVDLWWAVRVQGFRRIVLYGRMVYLNRMLFV
jgi:hypothetical protein